MGLLIYPRQGKRISGNMDGKIDKEYYYSLLVEDATIDDISEVADLLAEVHYLTHGEDIGRFRFTLYDKDNKPLRVRVAESVIKLFGLLGKNARGFRIAGLNWGNGDIYIAKSAYCSSMPGFLQISFHELGHGFPRSSIEPTVQLVTWLNAKIRGNLDRIECPAELNEIDSIVALMYLDPDLGYVILCSSPYGHLNHDYMFTYFSSEYSIALNYSLYRCIEGGQVKEYSDVESLQAKIHEKMSGNTNNELIRQIHQGVLEMFREKFADREDFEEKYSLLQQYMKYGVTDNSYEKALIPKEDVLRTIEEKERFIQKEHSPIIKQNLTRSLFCDYRSYDEPKAYALLRGIVTDKGASEWTSGRACSYGDLEWALKYACQQGNIAEARQFFDLMKRMNEHKPNDWIARRIDIYSAYLGADASTETEPEE